MAATRIALRKLLVPLSAVVSIPTCLASSVAAPVTRLFSSDEGLTRADVMSSAVDVSCQGRSVPRRFHNSAPVSSLFSGNWKVQNTRKQRRAMASGLTRAAMRTISRNGVFRRSISSSIPLQSGMGLPVGKHIVPDKPLSVNDELVWDNGTPFPEPCIDRIADTVGKYEALAWLCGGLSFFASLGLLAVWNDKASKIPFTPKVYPYDNLRVELGGQP